MSAVPSQGLTCRRILEEMQPVLYVVHDDEGDWQYLCGGNEHDGAGECRYIHPRHLFERDATLLEVTDLPVGYRAERQTQGSAWKRTPSGETERHSADCACCRAQAHGRDATDYDEAERKCIDDVERFGLHVIQIPPGVDDDGFSFSIGLYKRFSHPDVIVFGQKAVWQHAMLNAVADDIRSGRRFEEGPAYDGLIEGYPCVFRALRDQKSYAQYLGWNTWYYAEVCKLEIRVPVLQLVWPDLKRVFPGSPGYDSYRQPLLS